MDKRALISVAILAVGLAGCQSLEVRSQKAAQVKGQALAVQPRLTLPEACTAHMERVKLRDEPWVIINYRWTVAAENRDKQADDCRAYEDDYNSRIGAR